jgi:hypothetical protein
VRLLYRDMLLPKNVERRQWVNRKDRIKVFFNVAGENLCYTVLKLNMGGLYSGINIAIEAPFRLKGAFFIGGEDTVSTDDPNSGNSYPYYNEAAKVLFVSSL